MKKIILILFLSWGLLFAQKYAGFRASRILQSYPNMTFPGSDYWSVTGKKIAGKFSGYQPAGIWIVSLYMDSGESQFNFPSDGFKINNVSFIGKDQNEDYLSRFDSEGIKVWLQVEPGAANVDTLIHIVLQRYKHHKCVAGFGIDVEWLDPQLDSWGRRVTDAEAARWERKVKSVDTSYTLFLKHFTKSRMPASYRGNLIFIDDSQDFSTSEKTASSSLNYMISEFRDWGASFPKNKVAFQYGYSADQWWWQQFSDPLKYIGDRLISQVSNCMGLFWVDFTVTKLFPVKVEDYSMPLPAGYVLQQNYPNPFNPSTEIIYQIPEAAHVSLCIYDVMGKKVAVLVDEYQQAGTKHSTLDIGSYNMSSGVYFFRLTTDKFSQTKKMAVVK